jgi:hypothetical protein
VGLGRGLVGIFQGCTVRKIGHLFLKRQKKKKHIHNPEKFDSFNGVVLLTIFLHAMFSIMRPLDKISGPCNGIPSSEVFY